MTYNPQLAAGQAVMAASSPVVIASNQSGIPTKVTALTQTTGTLTTSTSVVTATTDVANAGSATIQISGTYAGVTVNFEVSCDGTTWIGIQGQRTVASVMEGPAIVLASNFTMMWDLALPGITQLRVRASAYTSGTANVLIAPAVNAFEVSPTVGFSGVSGATLSSVNSSGSSVTLLAANPARRGLKLHNSSTSTLYFAEAATASLTTYTFPVGPQQIYTFDQPVYTGVLSGIWGTSNGSVKITEEF